MALALNSLLCLQATYECILFEIEAELPSRSNNSLSDKRYCTRTLPSVFKDHRFTRKQAANNQKANRDYNEAGITDYR